MKVKMRSPMSSFFVRAPDGNLPEPLSVVSGSSAIKDPVTVHSGHGEHKINRRLAIPSSSFLTLPCSSGSDAVCWGPADADERTWREASD